MCAGSKCVNTILALSDDDLHTGRFRRVASEALIASLLEPAHGYEIATKPPRFVAPGPPPARAGKAVYHSGTNLAGVAGGRSGRHHCVSRPMVAGTTAYHYLGH